MVLYLQLNTLFGLNIFCENLISGWLLKLMQNDLKMAIERQNIVDRLNTLLDRRDMLFPARASDNTDAMHKQFNTLFDFIEKDSDHKWEPDDEFITLAEGIQNEAVFLCGFMKSGTTLLLGLLDGHSELNVMPGDSYLINKFSHILPKKNFSWEEWRKNWFKRMINPTGQKPFWIFGTELSCYARFLRYMDYWIEKLPAEKRKPMLAVVLSYFCTNPHRPKNPKWWVEKTPGNEFKVKDIIKHFPRTKFIHIVREPRDNFASLKRLYASRCWEWDSVGMVRMFSKSFKHAYLNQCQLTNSQYLVISYEDLTANTEAVMKGVTEFLDIAWNESLLKPTINKQPAQANTMYKERRVTGKVRQSGKGRWNDDLSIEEKKTILSILPEARKIGYDWEMTYREYLEMYFRRLRMRL